jgi:hypothetical protein
VVIESFDRLPDWAAVCANLMSLDRDETKFARWGYNHAYHFGDLSAATLPGHAFALWTLWAP